MRDCEILVCELWYIVVVMVDECWCDGVCEVFVGLLTSEVCEMVRVSGVMHRLGMVGLWGL